MSRQLRTLRITVDQLSDYPWPYLAKLEVLLGGEWLELDAHGGDTPAEAVATLCTECPTARRVQEMTS